MLCRAHTFICANNLINRICRLMFPLHEDVFQLSWLVTKYSPGFCYTHPTETGTGSSFLHFFCCGRVNERTVQLHVSLLPEKQFLRWSGIPRHRYEKIPFAAFSTGVVLRLIRHLHRWACAIDLIRHGFLVLHSNDSSPVARCFHVVPAMLFRRQSLRGQ